MRWSRNKPCVVLVVAACASVALAGAPVRTQTRDGHDLFAWAGDPAGLGTDFLIEGPLAVNGLVVLDIADGDRPVEVARLRLGDSYFAHWTGWDPKTRRLVVASGRKPEDRLYLVRLDPETGAVSLDESFRDADGTVGFNFVDREWPQGWKGSALPHGVVFSR